MQTPSAAASTPFVVERVRREETPGGNFTPDARLLLTSALQASGLLKGLPDEAARTLLATLSFLTPNGYIQPGAEQVADVLGVSEANAKDRLRKLAEVTFDGVPLIHQIVQETGRVTCVLSRRLVSVQDAPTPPTDLVRLPLPPSHRDEILQNSRSQYARPRADVERIVAEQMGHEPEDAADTPEGHLRRRLLAVGIPRAQVHVLVKQYPYEQIEQQLQWLPYRRAKDPARFVVAAIENRYDAPPPTRVDQAMAEQEKGVYE